LLDVEEFNQKKPKSKIFDWRKEDNESIKTEKKGFSKELILLTNY
jgi:hypothetical protein